MHRSKSDAALRAPCGSVAILALLALGWLGCESEPPPVAPAPAPPANAQRAAPREEAADSMAAQLESVRTRFDQIEAALADARTRLQATTAEADQFAQTLSRLHDESAALQTAASEYGRNIEVLGERMRQAHAQAEAVEAYLVEVRTELAAAQQREAQFSSVLESLFAELSETRAQISAMDNGTGQVVPPFPDTQPVTQPAYPESDPG